MAKDEKPSKSSSPFENRSPALQRLNSMSPEERNSLFEVGHTTYPSLSTFVDYGRLPRVYQTVLDQNAWQFHMGLFCPLDENFELIRFKCEEYHLREKQGKVIKYLYGQKGYCAREREIFAAEIEGNGKTRLKDLFRGSPLLNRLLVKTGRGIWKLDLPFTPSKSSR